jgi:E3 ubiquitin-protein ligase RNF1/2
LRDDPNYDALISALYPDIDKYEEEVNRFHPTEICFLYKNIELQSSIVCISVVGIGFPRR